MEFIGKIFESESYGMIVILVSVVIVLWLLPAVLAFFFNRKHFKLILLACIPAGFSFIAWGGVLVWATTGKVAEKYVSRVKQEKET